MKTTQMIAETLQELEKELVHQIEDLSYKELVWRPDECSNSICFLFWHISRAEDIFISDYVLKIKQVFENCGWASKWGIQIENTGFGYGKEQLDSFPNPALSELKTYHEEVRIKSLNFLKTLGEADFDEVPVSDHPRRTGYTIGRVWGHLICEIGQHIGHIGYLRGLQRGLNQRGSVGDWDWINRKPSG